MTLFIQYNKRTFIINDLYVMVVTFLLSYWTLKILSDTISKLNEKRRHKLKKKKSRKNQVIKIPPSGQLDLERDARNIGEEELGRTILACIADNEQYVVIGPKMKKIIFHLVKAKIRNESLVISPNLFRLMATLLIRRDKSVITKVGSMVVATNNYALLMGRIMASLIAAGFALTITTFLHGLLILILNYQLTEACGFDCGKYFQQIPQDSQYVYVQKPAQNHGHLVISGHEHARNNQLAIYEPRNSLTESLGKISEEMSVSNSRMANRPESAVQKAARERAITNKQFRKSKKRPRVVTFDEFRKIDPVLSQFNTKLDEPHVPHNECPNIQDVMDHAIE